jgi:FkbM family methyltransferase
MKKTQGSHISSGTLQTNSKSAKIARAITAVHAQWLTCYGQKYLKKRLIRRFLKKQQSLKIEAATWKEINFRALNLKEHGAAKLLLNPFDCGFSREFNVYGFREPLNTLAFFSQVAKRKPTVLDVGGNLGYFALVELQAGAKKVIAVEPVPSTFKLLARTLENYPQAEVLNLAISDSQEPLKLYVATKQNVTSSFKQLILESGHELAQEITVKSKTLKDIADQYPIDMVRMDVEGHEYRILSDRIPDQVESLCIELHVLPPFNKHQAVSLLQSLKSQNFNVCVAINEMNYEYYEMIEKLGLKNAYKIATAFGSKSTMRPCIRVNPSFDEVEQMTPVKGQIHLLLER